MTPRDRKLVEKVIAIIEAGECLCDEQPCWFETGSPSFLRTHGRRNGQVCDTRESVVEEIREELDLTAEEKS